MKIWLFFDENACISMLFVVLYQSLRTSQAIKRSSAEAEREPYGTNA